MYINSPSGSVQAGVSIYDVMLSVKAVVLLFLHLFCLIVLILLISF